MPIQDLIGAISKRNAKLATTRRLPGPVRSLVTGIATWIPIRRSGFDHSGIGPVTGESIGESDLRSASWRHA